MLEWFSLVSALKNWLRAVEPTARQGRLYYAEIKPECIPRQWHRRKSDIRYSRMRQFVFGGPLLCLLAVPALASDPAGHWRVESGAAHIQTEICDGRLWGVVSWEKKPGRDSANPDPAKRTRPILGLPIIRGMRAVAENRWEGTIYNAQDGRTYQASVTLRRPDLLEVEGCILGGWLCSSEDWRRVPPAPASVGGLADVSVCALPDVAGLP
jgi:uncharacterized protein (DUF2147 family)